jgi:hypothetical protein
MDILNNQKEENDNYRDVKINGELIIHGKWNVYLSIFHSNKYRIYTAIFSTHYKKLQ